ncbi:MAG: hypothetical protein PHF86_06205 [Candidatus Nanoarchaeia archaeon]|nr:hypothetical protein [Candidatus Nanoarchaeia archaeon]
MFIGLMGVADDGTLVTPNGRRLFKVPLCIAAIVQRIQHKVAQLTWQKVKKK